MRPRTVFILLFKMTFFDAEICVDTDEIKPSQVSVSCD